VTRVDGLILWANLHLLFWLSIIPAVTAWMGQNLLAPLPTALYGVALLMPAIGYFLLARAIIRRQGKDSTLAKAVGSDLKGKVSLIIYVAGILLAFFVPWISIALYVLVPVMWIIPDKRIEKMMEHDSEPHAKA
jgi:uncharacterized membrane protein